MPSDSICMLCNALHFDFQKFCPFLHSRFFSSCFFFPVANFCCIIFFYLNLCLYSFLVLQFSKIAVMIKVFKVDFCLVYCVSLIRMCFSTFYHFSFALVDFCRQSDLMGPFRKTHENCHKRYDRTPERSGNAKHRSQQFLLYESPPAETRLTVYRRLSIQCFQ